MRLQLEIFLLIFFNFKKIQINCNNENIRCLLDNTNEENNLDEISIDYGKIQEDFITYDNPKYINFNESMLSNDLLVHLFSINCEVKADIVDNLGDPKLIKKINNDAYSIKIIKNTNMKIKLSLKQNNGDDDIDNYNENNNNNRKCPLVINSMFTEEYKLTIEEHNPTIFYFDDNLQNINLKYKLNEFTDDSYVLFSFSFNERATFEINFEEDIEFNKFRKISDSHNIFLTKKSFEGKEINNLNINVNKFGTYNKPVLLNFRVISNNFTPLILQKNYLNQGFITSNINYQHYYMEIFNGEEGEIMLHDKRQNGKLIGRICNNKYNSCTINDIYSFIKDDNDTLQYKEHIRKLKFNYSETEECDEGCYLLISYYHDTFETTNNLIIGFEFTLLTRIWDKDDWSKTNIVNIPNNEYIFGYFEKNLINQHYYSILLVNETKNELIIETRGKNFRFFYGEGKRRLNTYNSYLNSTKELIIENDMEMEIISYKKNKNKYISFAVRPKNFLEDIPSLYYFRIFQIKDINSFIMPLDSNIENNCKLINYLTPFNLFCFYLLKNDYNEFYLNFSVTPSSIVKDQLKSYYIYESEKTKSLDINEEFFYNLLLLLYKEKPTYTKQQIINNISNINLNFILLIFKAGFEPEDSYLSFFYDKKKEIYPQIYSNQIYKINPGNSFVFSFLENYYLSLNWINGKGELKYFESIDFLMDKNDRGKFYSTLLPNNKENLITFNHTEDFFLNSRLRYCIESDIVREIKNEEIISEIITDNFFPIYFYSKISQITLDINFKIINYKNIFRNYIIQGMFCEKETILKAEKMVDINFHADLEAQYDSCSNNGLLNIPYLSIIQNMKPYILIKIDEEGEKLNSNVLIQIISLNKYESLIEEVYDFIPINQFIIGSMNLQQNFIGFFISPGGSLEDKLILEFSTNNPDIIIDIDAFKELNEKVDKDEKNGIIKYTIDRNLAQENKFVIKKNYTDIKLLSGNYIFRYYYFTNRFLDVKYKFNEIYVIKEHENLSENKTRILLEFEKLNIYNKSNINNNIEIENKIEYIIFLNLFLKNTTKELLNSTAIISAKPIAQEKVNSSNKDDNFYLNITVDTTNVTDYIYLMQVKFYLNSSLVNDEMLAYSIEMNLTDILKKKKINEKEDDDDDNTKLLITVLMSTISVLIVIVIIVLIYTFKVKKKNKDLQEQVLSISFADEKDRNNNESSIQSRKTDDSESAFI